MKNFVKYLLITIPFIFLNIINVNASSISFSNLKESSYAYFTNCSSNNNCWNSVGETNHVSSSLTFEWISSSKINLVANSYGAGLSIHVDEGFIKDNYYTITLYLDNPSGVSLTPNTTNTIKQIGVGSDGYSSYLNAQKAINTSVVNDISLYFTYNDSNWVQSDKVSALSYTFKATSSGNYLFISFTGVNTFTNYLSYYGYNYSSHGSKAPTSDDIKNALSNNFNQITSDINNAQNSINNSINNSTNSINNNIDNMKDKQDETNNLISSENDDLESKSCGIICKLKGIVRGITNLPQTIWNFIKSGFDSIISIFKPEAECHQSANLFDYTKKPSSGNVTLIDNGFIFDREYVDFYIGDIGELSGKTFTLSANISDSSDNSYITLTGCYQPPDSIFPTCTLYLSNYKLSNSGSLTFTFENILAVRDSYYLRFYGKGVEFSNIMLVEGSSPVDYEPYGQEVCTESKTFFSWFADFFNKIFGGIQDLFTAIGNLPKLLIDGFKDLLMGLFIPTDEQLNEIINESTKLSENFGFVGEAVSFFLNIFSSLLGLANQNGCINLPEFTIGATSLFEEHTFWESQVVCLADNPILSKNIETIRTITSIALVSLFINFAASKFFNILSKQDDWQASGDAANVGGKA